MVKEIASIRDVIFQADLLGVSSLPPMAIRGRQFVAELDNEQFPVEAVEYRIDRNPHQQMLQLSCTVDAIPLLEAISSHLKRGVQPAIRLLAPDQSNPTPPHVVFTCFSIFWLTICLCDNCVGEYAPPANGKVIFDGTEGDVLIYRAEESASQLRVPVECDYSVARLIGTGAKRGLKVRLVVMQPESDAGE